MSFRHDNNASGLMRLHDIHRSSSSRFPRDNAESVWTWSPQVRAQLGEKTNWVRKEARIVSYPFLLKKPAPLTNPKEG